MRILWFAITPSMYEDNLIGYNGGGWVASLERLIRAVPDIELGIAFEHKDACFKKERDGVVYYPIPSKYSFLDKLEKLYNYGLEEQKIIPQCIKIINDFNPDIIHVFGSEWCFGLVAQQTHIPVIIHMQGSVPPIYNARFPSGYSKTDLIFYNGFNIKKILKQLIYDHNFANRAEREKRIFRICQNYMGRTEWDKNLTQLYNPNSQYFYCSEALRDVFYNSLKKWERHERNKIIFTSTISPPLYKGGDLIMKTAKLLKENTSIDFEWRIFGTNDFTFHQKKLKIKANNYNIKLMGVVSAENLYNELLDSDIFIHPSYIDNSPNSICEAQILGLPVISTNVGGISSLITHEKTGLIMPANDPFILCSYIKLLIQDKDLALDISKNAMAEATKRHHPDNILRDLLNTYNCLLK